MKVPRSQFRTPRSLLSASRYEGAQMINQPETICARLPSLASGNSEGPIVSIHSSGYLYANGSDPDINEDQCGLK